MTSVVVAGALASKPGNGGEAWVRLSWVLGLARLGVDVAFVEEAAAPDDDGVSFFREVVAAFGLETRAGLFDRAGAGIAGIGAAELEERAAGADLLVNLSGNLRAPSLRRLFRRAAYVDLDPGFTQMWDDQGHDVGLAGHDAYFSVGLDLGRRSCSIPSGGLRWRPVLPPVVLGLWPPAAGDPGGRFTTVASWRSPLGRVSHGGRTFGLKAHEFRKVARLPRLAPGGYEVALAIDPADGADRRLLEDGGWRLVEPHAVACSPAAYRAYVAGSAAEFSVAQGIYVETGSGWFSDRTGCYLACGRPALVQDTGFGHTLPTGEGLVPFRTLDEAAGGAARILADYERHARGARSLAEEHLDSGRVLTRFLGEVL